jgi:hypothetical protein
MEELNQDLNGAFGRPIPGQSLTSDPNAPAAYEQAPRYTTVEEASKYLWDFITTEEVYVNIMEGINEGIPVMEYVRVILFKEFTEGAFNPDLMMIMAEPLAFMIIALAERLDLDIEITGTDDDDDDEDEELFGVEVEKDKLEKLRNSVKSSQIPGGILTAEMQDELKNLPRIDSLLDPSPETVEGEDVERVPLDTPAAPPIQEGV